MKVVNQAFDGDVIKSMYSDEKDFHRVPPPVAARSSNQTLNTLEQDTVEKWKPVHTKAKVSRSLSLHYIVKKILFVNYMMTFETLEANKYDDKVRIKMAGIFNHSYNIACLMFDLAVDRTRPQDKKR